MGEEWGCHGGRLWLCLRRTINRQPSWEEGEHTFCMAVVELFWEYGALQSTYPRVFLSFFQASSIHAYPRPPIQVPGCIIVQGIYTITAAHFFADRTYGRTNETNARWGQMRSCTSNVSRSLLCIWIFLPYCLRSRLGPGKRWKWKITLQIHKYLSVCDVWITRVAYITELSRTWLIITYIPNNTPRWSIRRTRERHKGWMGCLGLAFCARGHRQVKGEVRNMQKEKKGCRVFLFNAYLPSYLSSSSREITDRYMLWSCGPSLFFFFFTVQKVC